MKFDSDKLVRYLQITLILFFWSWGLIWFSIRAEKREDRENNIAEKAVVFAGKVPGIVKKWIKTTSSKREHQEILLDPELEIAPLGMLQNCHSLSNNLYLLHYRYEGNNNGRVYLQNIKTGETAKKWDIPLKEIFKDLQHLNRELLADYTKKKVSMDMTSRVANNIPAIQINSPIIGEDSSLIFNCGSLGPAYKLDKNSRLLWRSEETVHHSIELDQDGNIWTCSVSWGHPMAKKHSFREDAVLCLNANGKKVQFYSLSDILIENKLFNRLLAATPAFLQGYGQDPYHLNDVLPVKNNGKFWEVGDLFLSIRNKSAIVQYRPRDGSVVWYQQGPWLAQHDINIVNDSEISVFNNNTILLPNSISEEGSNIAYYNFADGRTRYLGQGLFASRSEGRQTLTVDDSIFVEETNKGVYHLLDSKGAQQCRFYIPYYANSSHAMNPTWARLYLKSGSNFVLQ